MATRRTARWSARNLWVPAALALWISCGSGLAASGAAAAQAAAPQTGFEVPQVEPHQEATRAGESIFAERRLLEVVRSGGPLMIPIGLCSFLLMVFVFERAMSLRRGRIIPGPFVKRFLDQLEERALERDAALQLCDDNRSAVADVFRAGVLKWGRPSVEIEQAVLDAGERVATDLRRYLRLLNGVATICPLLGLLGTVLGMIQAFDAIAAVDSSVADPKLLIATGISQALLTTAAGMTVAIPALIAYLFFASRADRRVIEIDSLAVQLVNLISAEGLSGQATSRRQTKKGKSRRVA